MNSTPALSSAGSGKLWLVRSFEIPTSDSAYTRLANYSWTYDNALATFGFISVGLKSGAEQLLDQLQALQRTDGSLEFAFDTQTGDAAPYYRSGALAWVGLAAAAYRRKYDSERYDELIGGTIKYLLGGLRRSDGLIRGGPDVTWVSTQHNLLAVGFLRDIADQMSSKETLGGYTRSQLTTIHTTLGNAIVSKLFVVDSASLAHFKQGLDDAQIPLDVQALGAMFLKLRGDSRATAVANTIQLQFPLGSRKVSGGTAVDQRLQAVRGHRHAGGDLERGHGRGRTGARPGRDQQPDGGRRGVEHRRDGGRLEDGPRGRRSRRGQPDVRRVPHLADLGGRELAADRGGREPAAADPLGGARAHMSSPPLTPQTWPVM